jgi:hypothetical protein
MLLIELIFCLRFSNLMKFGYGTWKREGEVGTENAVVKTV